MGNSMGEWDNGMSMADESDECKFLVGDESEFYRRFCWDFREIIG